LTITDSAAAFGVTRNTLSELEVNRLTNIHHTSRIDGIAGAMKALGKTLEIRAI
jgi:hypothetical protein